jgi:uncharacterized damage-inducible protein DinB
MLVDILDRLLKHDTWTTRQLLVRARELSDAQLDRPFDLGNGSLRATFAHVIGNMEVWTDLIAGRPVDMSRGEGETARSVDGFIARLDAVAPDLERVATALAAADRLDELWTDTLDDPPTRKSYGGAIAHVISHSHIHRGEILHMLDRLGLRDLPEGDVLSWEQARHTEPA